MKNESMTDLENNYDGIDVLAIVKETNWMKFRREIDGIRSF